MGLGSDLGVYNGVVTSKENVAVYGAADNDDEWDLFKSIPKAVTPMSFSIGLLTISFHHKCSSQHKGSSALRRKDHAE